MTKLILISLFINLSIQARSFLSSDDCNRRRRGYSLPEEEKLAHAMYEYDVTGKVGRFLQGKINRCLEEREMQSAADCLDSFENATDDIL